jgi:16S rRNA (adenine1518-N6/adenine1519-N6)-dimethyltransferase
MEFETPADLVKAFQNRPNQNLGQHFLTDPSILRDIVSYGGLTPGDRVLEVGVGCGTLTSVLLEAGAKVTGVEIDADAVDFVRQVFSNESALTVHQADFLELDVEQLLAARDDWVSISNLPYQVGTEVFFRLAEHINSFRRLVLMFQKEVAERFCASAGEDAYGTLSVLSRLYTEPRIVKTLAPGAFYPAPEVSSSVVVFEPVEGTRIEDVETRERFKRVVKAAFQKRRKMIRNSLLPIGYEKSELVERLEAVGIDPRRRPEKLDFEAFVAIAEALG